jgi:hypothetical protein
VRFTSLLLLAGLGLTGSPLAAQRLEPTPFPSARIGGAEHRAASRPLGTRVPKVPTDAGRMVLGGVLLGAGGASPGP